MGAIAQLRRTDEHFRPSGAKIHEAIVLATHRVGYRAMSGGSDKGDKSVRGEAPPLGSTRAAPPRPPPFKAPAPIPEPEVTPRRLPYDELHDGNTLPELPVTLEVIYSRQTHEITAIETLTSHVQSIDKEWASKLVEIGQERKHLVETATRLSETAIKLLTARAIMQVVPSASSLLALLLGATLGGFAGAFTATWMWLSLHPPVLH
jgi:hypothetical protein